MSKGALTREKILERAAPVFNTRGYAGASLAGLMEATGLQKGGIYNHFGSKEELAAAAFDYAVARIQERFAAALRGRRGSRARLRAFLEFFRAYAANPPVAGGCPILNTAAEHDDGNPLLRRKAREAMDQWRQFLRRTVERGRAAGEFRAGVDPEHVATIFIATLEGAVLLAKLYRDPAHLERALAHLEHYLETGIRRTS